MRKLLISVIAAAFAGAAMTAAVADDKPYTAKPGIEKPGRAADDGKDTVKSGGGMDKPGRAADDTSAPPATDKPAKKAKKKKKAE